MTLSMGFDDTDLKKIVSHSETMIAKELKINREDKNMLIVSGKQKKIQSLKNRLLSLTEEEKAALQQTSAIRQISRIRSKAALQIQLKRDSLLMPLNELELKQSQLTASVQLMNEQKDEFENIIRGKIKTPEDYFKNQLNIRDISPKICFWKLSYSLFHG